DDDDRDDRPCEAAPARAASRIAPLSKIGIGGERFDAFHAGLRNTAARWAADQRHSTNGSADGSRRCYSCASRSPCSRVAWNPTFGQRSIVTCRLYLFVARNTGLPSTSVASVAACSRSKLRRIASSGNVSQRAVAMFAVS